MIEDLDGGGGQYGDCCCFDVTPDERLAFLLGCIGGGYSGGVPGGDEAYVFPGTWLEDDVGSLGGGG